MSEKSDAGTISKATARSTPRLSGARAAMLCAICVLFFQGTSPGGEEWPTLQGNAQRTGSIAGAIPPPYKTVWNVKMPGRLNKYTQVIAAGGRVYVSLLSFTVMALDDKNGSVLWSFEGEGPFMHSPAVEENRVFAACHDRNLYAISAGDGSELWHFTAQAGFWASPCLAEGKVFIGARDKRFYAVDQATGKQVWAYEAAEKILQTAAYRDGKVTFADENGRIYMLDAASGKELWKTEPMPSIGFYYTWPTFLENVVMYHATPIANVAGGFGRDSRALGWETDYPDDVTKLPAKAEDVNHIRSYLDANPDRQSVYVLDVKTGKLKSTVPGFAFMAVPHPAPLVAADGRAFFVHSGWYWGETAPAFLAEIKIGPDKIDIEDLLRGGVPGIFTGMFPSDIPCHITAAGNYMFFAGRGCGVFDINTRERFPLPMSPSSDHDISRGFAPSNGKIFCVNREEFICCQASAAAGGK